MDSVEILFSFFLTQEAITSHLQAMALVENIRTDFRKLSELVNLCDRDVRRCILTLQLLVESGRSKDQNYCVLTDAPIGEKTSEKTSDLNLDKPSDPQTGNEKSDNDDLDDFVVLKGRQTKRRRILDDHDSNSGDQYSCLPLQQASRGEGQNQDARKFPVVYGFGLRCFLPGLVLGESGSTTEYIQDFLKVGLLSAPSTPSYYLTHFQTSPCFYMSAVQV